MLGNELRQQEGYSDLLFGETSPRTRVGCMAHVVRKFKDVIATTGKDQRAAHPAVKIVKMIKTLYDIEDVIT